ncbi:MAG: META domain-containing protein [Alteromonadaceae bacterium]|nr:META domain-containing protein [Alteromonadaceae bacterium]
MKKILFTALAATALAGCATQPDQEAVVTVDQLTGQQWVVEDINGEGIIDNSRVTLNFTEENRVAGKATCNQYFARYSIEDQTLNIEKAATTMMACPEALMNQERRFLEALQNVRSFELDDTNALVLTGEDSRILAR